MVIEINRDTVSSGERKRFRLKNISCLNSVEGVSPVKQSIFLIKIKEVGRVYVKLV